MEEQSSKDLCTHFEKFAGREVHMVSSVPGVLQEIRAEAKMFGLDLRVCFDGAMQTSEFDDNRLNVDVKLDTDGKHRVGNDFRIG
jgi:hypothetical protein